MLKSALINIDMKRIDIYSARKIMTKGTELNSVLKPLTSSDSPSEKSKGERFVSARVETNSINISRNMKRQRGKSLRVATLKKKKTTL